MQSQDFLPVTESIFTEMDLWLLELSTAFELELNLVESGEWISKQRAKQECNIDKSDENILRVTEKAFQIDLADHPQISNYFDICVAYYQASTKQIPIAEKSLLSDCYYQLGISLFRQPNQLAAIAAFQIALAIQPERAEAHCNLGAIWALREQFPKAISCYQEALAIYPDLVEAHYNLGAVFLRLEQLDFAITHLETAIALKPGFAEAHGKLGAVFFQKNRLEEAIAQYQRAIEINPNIAEVYFNLGVAYSEQGNVEAAIFAFQQAIAYQPNFPDARTNLAVSMLASGNYASGWEEYEWRWQRKGMELPNWSQPLWDGSSLEGKTILLWAEQGFGDTIQFVRYVPLVKARGGRVIVQCPACLLRLLSTIDGIDRIVTENDELTEQIHCYAPLIGLPRIFATTLDTIPTEIPYLVSDRKLVECSQQVINSGLKSEGYLKVGIVWASSFKGDPAYLKFQRKKSCPLSLLSELLALPQIHQIQWYSLQVGQEASDIDTLGSDALIQNLNHSIRDFADTAALIAHLDLIISVDTAVAHLAGAMGKPVWVMLPFVADWRWLLDRQDSPWYPTMRLFRQKRAGEWQTVIGEMHMALRSFRV